MKNASPTRRRSEISPQNPTDAGQRRETFWVPPLSADSRRCCTLGTDWQRPLCPAQQQSPTQPTSPISPRQAKQYPNLLGTEATKASTYLDQFFTILLTTVYIACIQQQVIAETSRDGFTYQLLIDGVDIFLNKKRNKETCLPNKFTKNTNISINTLVSCQMVYRHFIANNCSRTVWSRDNFACEINLSRNTNSTIRRQQLIARKTNRRSCNIYMTLPHLWCQSAQCCVLVTCFNDIVSNSVYYEKLYL